jgi:hypothetical protein
MKREVRNVIVIKHFIFTDKNSPAVLYGIDIGMLSTYEISEEKMQILHELMGVALGKKEMATLKKKNIKVRVIKSIFLPDSVNYHPVAYGFDIEDIHFRRISEEEMQILYENIGEILGKIGEGVV